MPALQENDAMCAKDRAGVLRFVLGHRRHFHDRLLAGPVLLNYKFRMSASVRRA
jgi:hypothetical protein